MARSMGYTPPTPPDTAAQDDLDDLVRALHESGLSRALAGGVRSYPRLLHTVLQTLDADVLRSVIALASSLRGLHPDAAERLAGGLRRARTEAARTAAAPPEGPWDLFKRLRDPDTRRGIAAALAALSAIGAGLAEDEERRG